MCHIDRSNHFKVSWDTEQKNGRAKSHHGETHEERRGSNMTLHSLEAELLCRLPTLRGPLSGCCSPPWRSTATPCPPPAKCEARLPRDFARGALQDHFLLQRQICFDSSPRCSHMALITRQHRKVFITYGDWAGGGERTKLHSSHFDLPDLLENLLPVWNMLFVDAEISRWSQQKDHRKY